MTLDEQFWAIVDANWSHHEQSRLTILCKATERNLA